MGANSFGYPDCRSQYTPFLCGNSSVLDYAICRAKKNAQEGETHVLIYRFRDYQARMKMISNCKSLFDDDTDEDEEKPSIQRLYLCYIQRHVHRVQKLMRDDYHVIGYFPEVDCSKKSFVCPNGGFTEIADARIGLSTHSGEEVHGEEFGTDDDRVFIGNDCEWEWSVEEACEPVYYCDACARWHPLVKRFIDSSLD